MQGQAMRKGGMPNKGPRHTLSVRLPPEVFERLEDERAALDIPINSIVAKKLAESAGLPIPDFVVRDLERARERRDARRGEELPLDLIA